MSGASGRRSGEAPGSGGTGRSGPKGRASTHERLVVGARRLLESRVSDGIRVGDITAEAGVSHGTFYVYFSGIDELLELIGHQVADELGEHLGRVTEGLVGSAAVAAVARSYPPLYRSRARLVTNLDRASSRSAGSQSTSSILVDRLTRRVLAAIEADPDLFLRDVEIIASAVAGMIHRFTETWFGDFGETPLLNIERSGAILDVLVTGALEAIASDEAAKLPLSIDHADQWLATPVHGARNAIVFHDREISYSQLRSRADAAAGWLDDLGLGPGHRLALLLHNGVASFELTLAAWYRGVDVVPLDVHWPTDELKRVLATVDPRAIAFDDDTRAVVDSLPTDGFGKLRRIAVGQVGRENRYEKEISNRLGATPPVRPARGGRTIWFTSGTTADPKGVIRDEGMQERRRHARFVMSLSRIDESSVFLLAGPLYHSSFFALGLSTLSAGGTVVIMDRFEPTSVLAAIERWRVTTVLLSPAMLDRILAEDEDHRRHELRSLDCIIHTGAPCPIHLKDRALEHFGPIVYEWYAATEQGGTYITPQESIDHPGSVGRPWSPETQVRVFDEHRRPSPPDVVGSIGLRDPRRPPFTYDHLDPDVSPEFIDGFFITGDMGWLDDDGYLYIADRRSDRIITDGAIVYPSEVEAVINDQDGVVDSAVVGFDGGGSGQQVVAFVVLEDESVDLRQIQRSTRQRLAAFKYPGDWRVVDEVPRDASGKLSRRRLR